MGKGFAGMGSVAEVVWRWDHETWWFDEVMRGLSKKKKKLAFDVTFTKASCESHILGYGV